ncbi:MAG: hypothetical protein HZA28_05320 [Candidatus Omnitrophica bacterium]|nr:hypothetical protein [Candidatus Omnitrophota bacterium]
MDGKSSPRAAVPAVILFLITAVGLGGCRTLPSSNLEQETPREVRDAVVSVSGAMAGHPLSEEEARRLERQVVTDPGAQSAIKAITSSASAGPAEVKAKYCPVGGEHYAPNLKVCPVHNVPLKEVGK